MLKIEKIGIQSLKCNKYTPCLKKQPTIKINKDNLPLIYNFDSTTQL